MGANAVTSVFDFTVGQVLTAAQMDNVNCGIPVFADATARDAAFGGTGEKTLAEGQMCYLESPTETLQFYNGSAWITFGGAYIDVSSTQTFSGFTKGNATVLSKYTKIGDFVHFFGAVTLGSTSSITGSLDVVLPITAEGGFLYNPSASLVWDNSPGTLYPGITINVSTTSLRFVVLLVNGTYASNSDVSATVPFTWAVNDGFYWNHIYKAA
jgi:hypothetical protein